MDIILGIFFIVIVSIDLVDLFYYYRYLVVEVLVLSEIVGYVFVFVNNWWWILVNMVGNRVLSIFVGFFFFLMVRKLVIFEMGFLIKDVDEERGGRYSRIRFFVDVDDRRIVGVVFVLV